MTDQTENPSAAGGSPEETLAEFFDQYSLPESKTMLWNWYKATTSGNFAALSEVDRENIATFYERIRISGLMEAVYTIKTKEGQ